jgi:hypothetical protein
MQFMKRHLIGPLALSLVGGAALWSQTIAVARSSGWSVEISERRPVLGAPYSAKAVTTSTQTLADGTHITRTIEASIARDSEGRTRREEGVSSVGPWSTTESKQVITIQDPVAQVRYMIQPDRQVAVKVNMPTSSEGLAKKMAELEAHGKSEAALKEGLELQMKTKLAAVEHEGVTFMFDRSGEKAQVEDLGERIIEGVRAQGRRETSTIPAGKIGNDRPIEITSEVWSSPELKTIVLSKRTDPRVGTTEYKLTNISRAEPSRSLFEPPAGYTIKEEGARRE